MPFGPAYTRTKTFANAGTLTPVDLNSIQDDLGNEIAARGVLLSGLYSARPAASTALNGARYFATDKFMEWQCVSAAWVLVSATAPFVTTLPSSPVNGQRCFIRTATMEAAGSSAWLLQYDATSPHTAKWEVISGTIGSDSSSSGVDAIASAGFVALTGGTVLTAPATGEYDMEVFANLQAGSANVIGYLRIDPGSVDWPVLWQGFSAVDENGFCTSIKFGVDITQGTNFSFSGRTVPSSSTVYFYERCLRLTPLRISSVL